MKRGRRYKVALGDVYAIPLVPIEERIETSNPGEWAPQGRESYIEAQVVFCRKEMITLALHDTVFSVDSLKTDTSHIENSKVTHFVTTLIDYARWGTFKLLERREVSINTPHQLYRGLGPGNVVKLIPYGIVYSMAPPSINNNELIRGGSSLTGEALIDLAIHVHLEYVSDGYERINQDEKARDTLVLEHLDIDPSIAALTLNRFFEEEDPRSPTSNKPYGETVEKTWDELKLILKRIETGIKKERSI